jgi:hypothetical protein
MFCIFTSASKLQKSNTYEHMLYLIHLYCKYEYHPVTTLCTFNNRSLKEQSFIKDSIVTEVSHIIIPLAYIFVVKNNRVCDRICGPVVRVPGYRSRGPGFDSEK